MPHASSFKIRRHTLVEMTYYPCGTRVRYTLYSELRVPDIGSKRGVITLSREPETGTVVGLTECP